MARTNALSTQEFASGCALTCIVAVCCCGVPLQIAFRGFGDFVDEANRKAKQKEQQALSQWHANHLDPGEVTVTFDRSIDHRFHTFDLWPSSDDEAKHAGAGQRERNELIDEGRLILLQRGVAVKVVKCESRNGSNVNIRRELFLIDVLDGEHKGKTGWIDSLDLKEPNE